jgi:hypothetical protein
MKDTPSDTSPAAKPDLKAWIDGTNQTTEIRKLRRIVRDWQKFGQAVGDIVGGTTDAEWLVSVRKMNDELRLLREMANALRLLQDSVWKSMDTYSKQLGWGLTGIQPECWTLLDSAINELVQRRPKCCEMPIRGKCVLQDWVLELTFMQQSVLIASVRGPDGLRKDHPSKLLCRWLRRCFLISAFDKGALTNPESPGGGSFTGPSVSEEDYFRFSWQAWANAGLPKWYGIMIIKARDYLRYVDEMPHHFQLHLMHAAEIMGYKHPEPFVREFWNEFYLMIVNDAHLRPEPEVDMDKRLGDSERNWRAAEVVTAK